MTESQPPRWTVDRAAERRSRRILLVLVLTVGVAVAGFAGLVATGSVHWPKDQPANRLTPAQYQQVRSECEDYASKTLPEGFSVGGRRWADTVNQCMVDRSTDSP